MALSQTNKIESVRNHSIDVLRLLAALLIVFSHCHTTMYESVVRISIPLFLMITGYFYPLVIERGRFRSHLKKVVKLTLFASAIYAVFNIAVWYSQGILGRVMHNIFSVKSSVDFLLFNYTTLTGGHIWYLYSVIYAMVVMYAADKFKLTRLFYVLVPLLLVCLFVAQYTSFKMSSRCWLFLSLPLMYLGRWMAEGHFDKVLSKVSNKMCLVLCVLLFFCMCAEWMYKWRVLNIPTSDVYFASIIVGIFILNWSRRNPDFAKDSVFENWGLRYSSYIYVFHFMIINIFDLIVIDMNRAMFLLHPYLIFAVSLIVSMAYVNIKTRADGLSKRMALR